MLIFPDPRSPPASSTPQDPPLRSVTPTLPKGCHMAPSSSHCVDMQEPTLKCLWKKERNLTHVALSEAGHRLLGMPQLRLHSE